MIRFSPSGLRAPEALAGPHPLLLGVIPIKGRAQKSDFVLDWQLVIWYNTRMEFKRLSFKWKGAQMKCLIGCDRVAIGRGLCGSCYRTARLNVKAGKTSWAQLEYYGMAKPAGNVGRGEGPFTRMLKEKQEQPTAPVEHDPPTPAELTAIYNNKSIDRGPVAPTNLEDDFLCNKPVAPIAEEPVGERGVEPVAMQPQVAPWQRTPPAGPKPGA